MYRIISYICYIRIDFFDSFNSSPTNCGRARIGILTLTCDIFAKVSQRKEQISLVIVNLSHVVNV
jgi:hypothetical protein